jgi:Ca2+-binding EF-hand superfamily protein
MLSFVAQLLQVDRRQRTRASSEELTHRAERLFEEADTDNDGLVTKYELYTWLVDNHVRNCTLPRLYISRCYGAVSPGFMGVRVQIDVSHRYLETFMEQCTPEGECTSCDNFKQVRSDSNSTPF